MAVIGFTDLVNHADSGVIQRRCGFGFLKKTAEPLLIGGDIVGQNFDGDRAVETAVLGQIDLAHAPGTKLFHNLVVGDAIHPSPWTCHAPLGLYVSGILLEYVPAAVNDRGYSG